jgi:hypothetical protein
MQIVINLQLEKELVDARKRYIPRREPRRDNSRSDALLSELRSIKEGINNKPTPIGGSV